MPRDGHTARRPLDRRKVDEHEVAGTVFVQFGMKTKELGDDAGDSLSFLIAVRQLRSKGR